VLVGLLREWALTLVAGAARVSLNVARSMQACTYLQPAYMYRERGWTLDLGPLPPMYVHSCPNVRDQYIYEGIPANSEGIEPPGDGVWVFQSRGEEMTTSHIRVLNTP
jgi:hypothetical protein